MEVVPTSLFNATVGLKEPKKSDFESTLYRTKVEEALAKWEAAKLLETSRKAEYPRPKKDLIKEKCLYQTHHIPPL
jgi:hypothetical protein